MPSLQVHPAGADACSPGSLASSGFKGLKMPETNDDAASIFAAPDITGFGGTKNLHWRKLFCISLKFSRLMCLKTSYYAPQSI